MHPNHCGCEPPERKRPLRHLHGRLSLPETSVGLDHSLLFNRGCPDQHPMEAISGLLEELDYLEENAGQVVVPITNEELEAILI